MQYIVSYDISSDKKRIKASKLLENFGVRVQYSVFECELNKKELKELKAKLSEIINQKIDSVLFLRQCENCVNLKEYLGVELTIKRINILTVK